MFRKAKASSNVLFIDASRNFKAGKNQNLLTEETIAKVIDTYRSRSGIDKYSYL
ncbi:MAG: N-6 DNA methylase, partial [Methylobacter sp.]|nr:N-6 DNA methylase [Methylobacter sp.]